MKTYQPTLELDYAARGELIEATPTGGVILNEDGEHCRLFVVVVRETASVTPYVVARYQEGNTQRGNGRYCPDLASAVRHYETLKQQFCTLKGATRWT